MMYEGVLISFAILVGFVAFFCGHDSGYRAGQIDAANGVMKYELVKTDDGETVWEWKDELDSPEGETK